MEKPGAEGGFATRTLDNSDLAEELRKEAEPLFYELQPQKKPGAPTVPDSNDWLNARRDLQITLHQLRYAKRRKAVPPWSVPVETLVMLLKPNWLQKCLFETVACS